MHIRRVFGLGFGFLRKSAKKKRIADSWIFVADCGFYQYFYRCLINKKDSLKKNQYDTYFWFMSATFLTLNRCSDGCVITIRYTLINVLQSA